MFRRVLLGAVAGAAGTAALNAATYLDMAARGRPSSSTPEQMVEKVASSRGIDIPGEGEERDNRLSGLGALSGIATGVAVGIGLGVLDIVRLRPTGLAGVLFAGGGAMAMSNASMAAYGVTDPTSWSAQDWLSDLLPHLAYGVAVSTAFAVGNKR